MWKYDVILCGKRWAVKLSKIAKVWRLKQSKSARSRQITDKRRAERSDKMVKPWNVKSEYYTSQIFGAKIENLGGEIAKTICKEGKLHFYLEERR